jgi:hypothetical protein
VRENPKLEDRTVHQALAHAEDSRELLPRIVQVSPYDWDIVVLADEIYRLRKLLEEGD